MKFIRVSAGKRKCDVKYKISQIAKIIGVSSEAVRLYEKKGVLKTEKDEESGYRLFHALDIGTMLRCRSYAQFGLSLSEAASLINDYDLEQSYRALVGQEARMQQEIERQMRCLVRLKELNQLIAGCERDAGVCRMQEHPGILRIDYHHNGVLMKDSESLKQFPQWSALAPLSFISLRIPVESMRDSVQDYYAGLGILEEDAEILGIRDSKNIRRTPKGLAVRTVLKVSSPDPLIGINAFQGVYAYALDHGCVPLEEAYTRMIIVIHRSSDKCVRYYEVFLPVKAKK